MMSSISQKPYFPFLLSLLSGILLSLGWILHPVFLFFGFIPLLEIEIQIAPKQYKYGKWRFWFYCFVAFWLWNLGVTYWILNATVIGGLVAITLNALLMTIPFLFFRSTKNILNERMGYLSWVLYWLCWEYLHLHWSLSWTWLTLGNVFAFQISWVQWYEYTGVLGGSLWILVMNVYIYLSIRSYFVIHRKSFLLQTIALFTLPILFSWWINSTPILSSKSIEAVVVQHNIDPYQQKFQNQPQYISPTKQLNLLLDSALRKMTSKTQLLVFPEASLLSQTIVFNEDTLLKSLNSYPATVHLQASLHPFPKVSLLTGMSGYRLVAEKNRNTTTRFRENVGYYQLYNSVLFYQAQQKPQIYHKSKLIPGLEYLPFYPYSRNLLLYFGGVYGVLTPQSERTVFKTIDSIGIAPVICYESIFGDFMREYIQSGAHIFCILSNDGWWGDSQEPIQHFAYARLRAIEFRRSVVRCANNGISGFIDLQGNILQKSEFWTSVALRQSIPIHQKITFYAKYGDYIGRLAWFLAIGLFLTGIVKNKTGEKNLILRKG